MWMPGLPPRDGELYMVSFRGGDAQQCYACARWAETHWRVGLTKRGQSISVIEDMITHWCTFDRLGAYVPRIPRRRRDHYERYRAKADGYAVK